MTNSQLYVGYPDGEIRYGIWSETSDIALPDLFDTPEAARDWWDETLGETARGHEQDCYAVDVEIATNWFWWRGRATRHAIIHDPDLDYSRVRTHDFPAWLIPEMSVGWVRRHCESAAVDAFAQQTGNPSAFFAAAQTWQGTVGELAAAFSDAGVPARP